MESHQIATSKGFFATAFALVVNVMSWLGQTLVENNELILTIIPIVTCVGTIWYFTRIIKLREREVSLAEKQANDKPTQPQQLKDQ